MTLCPSCQTKHRGQSAEQHIEGQDRKNNHADKVHRAAGLHLGAEFIHDTAVRLVGNIVNGIVPAQADDGSGAIVLLKAFGERHSPEQPGHIAALFRVGDTGEVFVLRRFDVFAPAAGVQIGESLGPYGFVCEFRLARSRVIEPDEDACRCDEQQQHQKRSKFHGGDRNSFRIPCAARISCGMEELGGRRVHFLCQRNPRDDA